MKTKNLITNLYCILLISAAFATLLPTPVQACSIPVFRYALERWSADDYEVIVFHRDALSSDEQKIIDRLKKASSYSDSHANVIVKTVNLSTSPDERMKRD